MASTNGIARTESIVYTGSMDSIPMGSIENADTTAT